ncbi:hypothetical protein [Micromonospora chersina]
MRIRIIVALLSLATLLYTVGAHTSTEAEARDSAEMDRGSGDAG